MLELIKIPEANSGQGDSLRVAFEKVNTLIQSYNEMSLKGLKRADFKRFVDDYNNEIRQVNRKLATKVVEIDIKSIKGIENYVKVSTFNEIVSKINASLTKVVNQINKDIVKSDNIKSIVTMSQEEYDKLGSYNDNTLYLIYE